MHEGMRPIVLGAGWSGLACAVELVREGMRPLVLDAAPQPGGRARAVEHELAGKRFRLDNGQHLLLGAYRDTLELMQIVGVAQSSMFLQSPFAVSYPDGWHLSAAQLPAPWHLALGLARAQGIGWAHRWALAAWVQRQRRRRWSLPSDVPAAALFEGQPAELTRRLWRPLCLAALNVELEHASARMFLNVLRDSLGADEPASRLLQPRADLSALFPEAAVRWLLAKGADVRLQCAALAVSRLAGQDACQVHLRDKTSLVGPVVLAVPPDRAAALLDGKEPLLAPVVRTLRNLRFAPICTVYLRCLLPRRLARPFYALLDDPARHCYGQWVFDRGAFDRDLDGILSVVISGSGPHTELSRPALAGHVARQVCGELRLAPPLDQFTIVEKHATLVPGPDLQRPETRLPAAGLFLAADSAASPYPSTIEGSVRAGRNAARALVQSVREMQRPSPQ